jgi:hypothetical protein
MADRLLLEYPTKILLETGVDALLLEDGSLLLNEASATLATDAYQLQDGSGVILLEPVSVANAMTASSGIFSITGQNATLQQAKILTATHGLYTLTGQNATVKVARLMSAGFGAYAITGQSATLLKTVAGTAYAMTAQAGTYALSGKASSLTVSRGLTATHGLYTITGQNATVQVSRTLSAQFGAFAITGQDATMVWAGSAVAYAMSASAGLYGIAGSAAILTYHRFVPAPLPSIAGNGNLSGFEGFYGRRPAKKRKTLQEKKRVLIDYAAIERKRLEEEEAKRKAEELALLARMRTDRPVGDPIVAKSSTWPNDVVERMKQVDRDKQARLAKREQEIEDLLLSELL